jgi:hypothetical protein
LLKAALKKLEHENMDTKNVNVFNIETAMKITRKIQKRAHEIEGQLYHYQKKVKKLTEKPKAHA